MENKIEKLPTLLTVKEVASILNIEINTAYNLIYTKKLPVLRLGPKNIRIPKCIFIRWIKNIKDIN